MTASLVRYTDEKFVSEVPVAPLDAWVNIDLAPYLDDSSSLGVLLRVTKATTSGPTTDFGARGAGQTGTLTNIFSFLYSDFPVKFVGAGKTVDFQNDSTNILLSVIGEIHGPHVRMHDAVSELSLSFNDWFDVTPALIGGDVIGDVAAVILKVRHAAPTVVGTWGLREKGSTDLTHDSGGEQGWTMYIIGLSASGEYQYFTSSKFGFTQNNLHEVGYILKTSNVVTIIDPVDEALPRRTPSFGELDVSGVVSSKASIVGGSWRSALGFTKREAFLRARGSTDDGFKGLDNNTQLGQSVALDSDFEAEYTLEDALIDFWVQWYMVGPGRIEFESAIIHGICFQSAIIPGINMESKIVDEDFVTTEIL